MRIVAGKHKGRTIVAPEGQDIRPTSDRVRESLFNILEHRDWGKGGLSPISDARVFDAFCGTGALGLEALSRGAVHATFLDNNTAALALCRRNVATLDEQNATDVLTGDCLKPVRPSAPCNLVFLDPPYRENIASAAMSALSDAGWIAENAICVVETGLKEEIEAEGAFSLLEDRKYASTRIRIYRYSDGGRR